MIAQRNLEKWKDSKNSNGQQEKPVHAPYFGENIESEDQHFHSIECSHRSPGIGESGRAA